MPGMGQCGRRCQDLSRCQSHRPGWRLRKTPAKTNDATRLPPVNSPIFKVDDPGQLPNIVAMMSASFDGALSWLIHAFDHCDLWS